jgi:hypothetical protein
MKCGPMANGPKAPRARLVFQRQFWNLFAVLPIFPVVRSNEECDAQEEKMDRHRG